LNSSNNIIDKSFGGRLHVFGVDAQVDPVCGKRFRRGIFGCDRIHTLVMGFPGCGKTRFLLSLILQHVECGEGFLVLDSHRDLTWLVLSHIPPEKWDRIIYINPWSAFEEKYGHRVVQINFLECKDRLQRDVVARMFMDTLEKIYEKWWGPRLDMILLNALYLLMEKEFAKLPDLYRIFADVKFREKLVSKCEDEHVKLFWQEHYSKMPKDASIAVLTKMYRLVQERVIVPLFMTEHSGVDFREAMDQGKIVIVDLPEGKLSTDIADFVGSLILSKVYLAGMSREDTPEEQRVPFFVYVDEAYRYSTKSIPETLQSLRKFKVYMTLASQYLEQYRRDIQESLSQTCETIISFRVGEHTARTLEKFFPKEYGYQTLMSLPRHLFFVSTPFCGNREYQILKTIDYKIGPNDPDQAIKESLQIYGTQIDHNQHTKPAKKPCVQQEFLDWPVTPAEWLILLQIRKQNGSANEKTLKNQLVYDKNTPKPYALTETWFNTAIKSLSIEAIKRNAWLNYKDHTTTTTTITANAKQTNQTDDVGKDGNVKVRRNKNRTWSLDLTDSKARQLLDPQFKGDKAGDVKHIQAIINQNKTYWEKGWITRIDTGESCKSIADIYVTPTIPLTNIKGVKGCIDPHRWDYERSFAVEVEIYPNSHWERVKNNYERNRKMGFPTLFIVPTQKLAAELRKKLREWNAIVVINVDKFEPNCPEMAALETMQN